MGSYVSELNKGDVIEIGRKKDVLPLPQVVVVSVFNSNVEVRYFQHGYKLTKAYVIFIPESRTWEFDKNKDMFTITDDSEVYKYKKILN